MWTDWRRLPCEVGQRGSGRRRQLSSHLNSEKEAELSEGLKVEFSSKCSTSEVGMG